MLPQCLHLIAEIYSSTGNYETAISFVQAEKLYYETFLINVGGDPQKTNLVGSTHASADKDKTNSSSTSKPTHQTAESSQGKSDDATKASEYEKLAHMCLKQKNIQLALEYCGKAVKLRQAIYGENSPITRKSLDLFTVIYAEMGKEQYSAAMQKYATRGQKNSQSHTEPPHEDLVQPGVASTEQQQQQQQQPQLTTRTATIPPQPREQKEEQVAAAVSKDPSDAGVTGDASVTSGRALLLYLIVTVLVAMVITIFYWRIWQDADFTTTYKQIVTRIKYYYYYYFRRAPVGNEFY